MSDVGPILQKNDASAAVIEAIRGLNANVRVVDRGSYWRVLVEQRCVVTQAAIEAVLGKPFLLPTDLESCMPSFSGRFSVSSERAMWEAGREGEVR
jgi:hypothetical protein